MKQKLWPMFAAAAVITMNPAPLPAQPETPVVTFEVASVRPHKGPGMRSGPLTVSSPLIRLEAYTVFGLTMDAYHLRDFQLSFGSVAHPDDIYDTMYDVTARAPGGRVPTIDEARVMLQALLADRFRLKVHRETREMPVYALVPGRNNSALKVSSAGDRCRVQVSPAPDGRNLQEVFSNCPIERLADHLGNLIGDRPVLDQTGLAGGYDFSLLATPEYRSRSGYDPADISPISAVGVLGLKLAPQKTHIEILAVDHVEKPAEN